MQERLDMVVFLQERLDQHLLYLQVHLPRCQLPLQGTKRPQEVLKGKEAETLHRSDQTGLSR